MLEFDVTEIRRKLMELRRAGKKISFNGWLVKVVGEVLHQHPEAAAYLFNKKNLIIFNDINISVLVEKKLGDKKVPIPLVIEKANEKSALTITLEIENAKTQKFSEKDVVLTKRTTFFERLYYFLPGIIRRAFWKWMLSHPRFAFKKMGNVAVTSVGMIGKINGWFIHSSVHPVSFGIGSVIKKPVVVNNEIKIREVLNMTILVDHDVIDGAPMVRFLQTLTGYLESEAALSPEELF